MFLTAVAVNYLAIFIAAIVAFIIGSLWYSPMLFGPTWQGANKVNERKPEEMRSMPVAFAVTFAGYVVTAYVIAILLKQLNVIDLQNALQLSTLLWLGFTAAVGSMHFMFSNRSLVGFLIDLAYEYTYIIAITVVLWWFK